MTVVVRKKARKKKPKPVVVEFELVDAPGQMLRVSFATKRRALWFVNFDDDNDLICYAAIVA